MRPELKQPKNAAGMVLIFLSVMTAFITYEYNLTGKAYYIAAALYAVGMILIVIPGTPHAADHEADHQEPDAQH